MLSGTAIATIHPNTPGYFPAPSSCASDDENGGLADRHEVASYIFYDPVSAPVCYCQDLLLTIR